MPVIINGSTGISGVDGSAASPAIEGSDTNTGMFFPAADTIAFAEGGVEVLRINSSAQTEFLAGTVSLPSITASGDLNTGIFFPAADSVSMATAGAERFRFGPSGQLGIGGATYGTSGQVFTSNGSGAAPSWQGALSQAANGYITLQGGIIIQWGEYTMGASTTTTHNFPIAFPTRCSGIGWGMDSTSTGQSNNSYVYPTSVSQFRSVNGIGTAYQIRIIAVGY